MKFEIDPKAPVLAEDIELMNGMDVADIMVGASLICETIQDNDIDRWSLTRAGQFVRETGEDGGRFYVWPKDEAIDYLDGMVVDEVMDAVKAAVADRQVSAPGT